MENNNNRKIFTYLLVVFFAVFVGSGLFLVINNKKSATTEQAASTSSMQKIAVIPTVEMSNGYINLKNYLTSNKLSSPVSLNLVASSNGENITAFDTLISYDPLSFDFVKAESLDSNFKVYSYKYNNSLTLTVAKTGSSTIPSVFSDTKIVNLVFQPKKTGQFTFKVVPSVGKETTKFVNDQTKVIYPSLNEVKVTIN